MAFEAHRKRFGIVAAAAADLASDIHIRKKIHFDAPQSIALASFAPSAFDVEAEAPRTIAALQRFRKHREKFANRRENASVSGRIRTRSAPNRSLVDLNDFVDLIGADDFAVRSRRFLG